MPLTFYEVTLDRGIPFAKAQAIQAEWLEKLKALRTEEQRTKEAEQLQEQRRKQREKEERRKLIYAQRKRERDEERAKKRKAAAAKRAQASGKGKGRKVVVEEEEESSSEEELELEIVGDEDEDEEEDAEEEAAKEVWVSPLGLCLDWVPLLIAHMCSIETFVVTSTRLISLFRSKPNQPKAAKKAAEEKAKKDKEEYNDGAGTGFYRCVLVFALRACGRLTDVIVAWRHSTARRPVHARLKPVIPRPSPPLPRRHPPPPPGGRTRRSTSSWRCTSRSRPSRRAPPSAPWATAWRPATASSAPTPATGCVAFGKKSVAFGPLDDSIR